MKSCPNKEEEYGPYLQDLGSVIQTQLAWISERRSEEALAKFSSVPNAAKIVRKSAKPVHYLVNEEQLDRLKKEKKIQEVIGVGKRKDAPNISDWRNSKRGRFSGNRGFQGRNSFRGFRGGRNGRGGYTNFADMGKGIGNMGRGKIGPSSTTSA
jgi:hypothetical protein